MSTPQPARRQVTTSEAAELLDVPPSVIAMWKVRRKVMPVAMLHGRGRGGHQPLYRLSELQPLAAEYHRRVATRRPETGDA